MGGFRQSAANVYFEEAGWAGPQERRFVKTSLQANSSTQPNTGKKQRNETKSGEPQFPVCTENAVYFASMFK